MEPLFEIFKNPTLWINIAALFIFLVIVRLGTKAMKAKDYPEAYFYALMAILMCFLIIL